MALFITFEGEEGSGKSTQARLLYRHLQGQNIPSLLTHEPGVTGLGKKITRLLKWSPDTNISAMTELLLFNASRAQLVSEVIRPSLERGETVICDRYADSTMAYQGYGRGLDLTIVAVINQAGTGGLSPDVTFLLDMPVELGLVRKAKNADRFEAESIDFHKRVREGYLKLAATEPRRWCIIDATLNRKDVAGIIRKKLQSLLPR